MNTKLEYVIQIKQFDWELYRHLCHWFGDQRTDETVPGTRTYLQANGRPVN